MTVDPRERPKMTNIVKKIEKMIRLTKNLDDKNAKKSTGKKKKRVNMFSSKKKDFNFESHVDLRLRKDITPVGNACLRS